MGRKFAGPLALLSIVVAIAATWSGRGRLWGQGTNVEAAAVAALEPYIFVLELEGQPVEEYTDCRGLGSHNEIDSETSVTSPGVVVTQKVPGALGWNDITLTRTGPSDALVWEWRRAMEELALSGAIRDGAIIIYRAGSPQPIARWTFDNGWAASLVLNGTVEELTIVHDGLRRTGTEPPGPPARR
jgi:hypothetical protein